MPQKRAAPKPVNLGFEQAAAVPISAITALQGLRDKGRLQPGQRVLVIGAAGGVGSFAVQLAKAFGADVTGVSARPRPTWSGRIGADEVIDYTREDFTDGRRRYDLILDIAGNRPLSLAPAGPHPQGDAGDRRRRGRGDGGWAAPSGCSGRRCCRRSWASGSSGSSPGSADDLGP